MSARTDPPRAAVMLVDDDPLIVDALRFTLADEFDVHAAGSRGEAHRLLDALPRAPSLALIDLGLPPTPHAPEEGYALIVELLARGRTMRILVLSGQSDRRNVQHALTLGAVDFLPKPCDAELLRARLHHQLAIQEVEIARHAPGPHAEDTLIGDSAGMQALRALIAQFANSPFPVLIEGESGVGKELVAACLHREGHRAGRALRSLNCAAFSPELLEAHLFGAVRGAYTGADRTRAGLLEEVGDGTLFLDEVGEMPLELQAKLLRVLEDGEYYRLGDTQPRRSGARVIAATNRDLREATRAGAFRADLFHRLSVLTVGVPPLRARGDDWRRLCAHFIALYRGTIEPFELTEAADALLAGYAFPGNVRELRNIVVRLGTKFGRRRVDAADLQPELEPSLPLPVPARADTADGEASLVARLRTPGFRLDDAVAAFERRLIGAALAQAGGNLSRAARLLGVNRTTLYSKLARLGMNPPADP
ncbi:MAG: sigma-54-dependent transcriptional regulator [Gammaproteobacteria bacterium]